MNCRIRLVSDTKVEIERYPRFFVSWSRATCTSSCYRLDGNQDGDLWDTEGRAALMEALACLRDTGSFAALADTSAVPFVGKRMRRKSGGEVVYLADYATDPMRCYVRPLGGYEKPIETWMWRSDLAPLAPEPPKPRYRPYTPVEAAAHVNRHFMWKNFSHPGRPLKGVYWEGVFDDANQFHEYGAFARDCVWADTKLPCGIPEQP